MFKGSYLRVLTPVTSDGVSPVVENDRIKYREDQLPLTARKMLESKNQRLPTALRKKIEVVSDTVRPVIKTSPKPAPVTDEFEDEDLHNGGEQMGGEVGKEEAQQPKPKGKGGRPAKVKA